MKNVELLLKAKASILAQPEHFDMAFWLYSLELGCSDETKEIRKANLITCGITACIAGWIVHHAIGQGVIKGYTDRPIDEVAWCLLGLDEERTDPLFLLEDWPEDLAARYEDLSHIESDKPARAAIAAERIDRFIQEHGGSNQ